MSKRWAAGSTRAWRRARAACLTRDGHRCQLRLPGCTVIATQAHHLGPREVTGDALAMLLSACAACNYAVGDPTRADPDPDPAPIAWWE